jgi:hypothetical protein
MHEEMRNTSKMLLGNPEEEDDSEDLEIDGSIILKCIL